MTGISVASIAVLYGLFVAGFPRFLQRLSDGPTAAVRNDPVSPVLVLAGMTLAVSLVALIVVFGARHAPPPGKTGTSDDQQRSRSE